MTEAGVSTPVLLMEENSIQLPVPLEPLGTWDRGFQSHQQQKSRKRRSSNDREGHPHQFGRTLKQYTVDEKLEIIRQAKMNGNRAAGREFNVAESSIREWRKNEQKLINSKRTATQNMIAVNNKINFKQMKFCENVNNNQNSSPFVNFNVKSMLPFQAIVNGNPSLHNLINTTVETNKIEYDSTLGSVGTPNSISSGSSSSTPPPSTSPKSGSGRRKKCQPQKVIQEP